MFDKLEFQKKSFFLVLFGILAFVSPIFAQSTNLDYPTPVLTDQIAGRIRARDIGDSRLTSHYYIFETGTGDVVLNIETSNLNGDIDIYTAGSMRPLLKASVYAVGYATVMQRQVYLRIPSRLVLRIEGRTPGDDPASYAIKFGGVFKPIAASAVKRNPGDPKVSGSEANEGAVARVNSAGTIIEEIRQPPPPVPPKETVKNTGKEKAKPATTVDTRSKSVSKPTAAAATGKPKTDTTAKKTETEKTAAAKARTPEKPKTGSETAKSSSSGKKPAETKPKSTAAVTKPPKNVSDPLAKVELVVDMKDGRKLKYAMNDVLRVNVDRNVVTIILKNGDIERLSLLDIEEMKIGQ
ncbi:MAG TPA: hypothetical protein VGO50_06825 [Pyrinomonadaceae bacterium]|nr:hypothetical protein [Pyrinomonadaceae bacterium]